MNYDFIISETEFRIINELLSLKVLSDLALIILDGYISIENDFRYPIYILNCVNKSNKTGNFGLMHIQKVIFPRLHEYFILECKVYNNLGLLLSSIIIHDLCIGDKISVGSDIFTVNSRD